MALSSSLCAFSSRIIKKFWVSLSVCGWAWPVNRLVKSTWWETICAHTVCEGLRSNKNYLSRAISVAAIRQKCQEVISAYPKTQDYSGVYPIVIRHHFACINLDSEWVYVYLCFGIIFVNLTILIWLLYHSSILVHPVISTRGVFLIINI